MVESCRMPSTSSSHCVPYSREAVKDAKDDWISEETVSILINLYILKFLLYLSYEGIMWVYWIIKIWQTCILPSVFSVSYNILLHWSISQQLHLKWYSLNRLFVSQLNLTYQSTKNSRYWHDVHLIKFPWMNISTNRELRY